MWNKDKSILLSQILVKICYAAVAVCCFTAPYLVRLYNEKAISLYGKGDVFLPLLITLYACVPFAVCALVCLDILLFNIKKNRAFIARNVTMLRVLSYCCFAVAVIFVYFAVLRPFAFTIVFAAAFFGIILRVVKNCFQQAVAIREENDFTI